MGNIPRQVRATYLLNINLTMFVYSSTSNFSAIWRRRFRLCLAFMTFSSECYITCHTYCDTGPRFINTVSHPKDRHPRPTVGFDPSAQTSSDLCAVAITTVPRGRNMTRQVWINSISHKGITCWYKIILTCGFKSILSHMHLYMDEIQTSTKKFQIKFH
jgi:hypothetical protein